jgi:PAS domain-containing protein
LADCALTYISPGFSALTGYEPSEIIGKNCRILQGACLP